MNTKRTARQMSAVSNFLEQNGLNMYICIMDDQGFEDLADLAALAEDEASFKDLVPALGHRTKIKRLLCGLSTPQTATPASTMPVISTAVPMTPSATSEVAAVRRTPLVAWLEEHQLEAYAMPLQRAGYDHVEDLAELLKSPELLEHLVPIVGHRDRIRRILGVASSRGSFAEQWLGGVKLPAERPDPELASSQGGGCGAAAARDATPGFVGETDAVNKLLGAVGSNFVTRGKSVSPPTFLSVASAGLDAESSSTSSSHERPPPAVKRSSGNAGDRAVTIGDGSYAFDVALFVDNPGLDASLRRGNGILCKKLSCDSQRCRDLHFREIQVKHEHMKRTCSAAYVYQVTLGYLTALRKGDRVVACMEDNCNSTSCPNAHIGFPLRREVSHNGGAVLELGNFSVPLRDCSFTDALVRLMERPVSLLERRTQQNVRVCPSFALSQTCPKGVRCWNYHILPTNFSRFFWKSFPLDRLNRHLHSLNHLHGEQYDVTQRMERTGRRSFEVGEALDIMVHTSCRPCALIFFESFRSSSRRQGSDLFWALLHRLHSHQGREDALVNELMLNVNNVLQLRHSEALSSSTPIESMVGRMAEAIAQNLKKSGAYVERSFGDGAKVRNAYVYWDFDNILFAERNDLTLFYQCLMTYLSREGYASNKSAVHVKAFGTQHSFATETVDALRDMQVEMVLCSSKKQEETDRQMERSMRSLEGRNDCTVVILSSDKDFGSVAKELTRTGVHVVVIHCADESSNHDSMLQMSSSESRHIFEVYASALKLSKPSQQRKWPASSVEPPTAARTTVHHDPAHHTVSAPGPSIPDPAIIASHEAREPRQATQSVLSFFKQPVINIQREDVNSVAAIEHSILSGATGRQPAAFQVPHPRSSQSPPMQTVSSLASSEGGGINLANYFAKKPAAPLTAPKVVPLVSLAQNPLPPRDHRSWYSLFVDAFLVRLQDRQRAGDLRGPFSPNASEESVRREMKVYMEMANMVPGFLPDWFRPEAALRSMYIKVMDDSPDDWMNNEHFLSTYEAEQFVEVFAVLRYISTVVEGPLLGHEEHCVAPECTLRLKRQS